MITPVDPMLALFAEAGADIITVHVEAGPHAHRSVQAVKALGKRAGISLNPSTPPDAIDYLIGEVDLVLAMTVNPGFGGQSFIASQLDKIRRLRQLIEASGRPIELEVDGGITPDNAGQVVAAGADVLVAGTAAFAGGAGQYRRNIERLRGGG
jgi:ribulose-phosphate 3-epimerase